MSETDDEQLDPERYSKPEKQVADDFGSFVELPRNEEELAQITDEETAPE